MKRKQVLSIDPLSSTIVVEDPGAADGATKEYVMKRYNVSEWSQDERNSALELYTRMTQWTQASPHPSVRSSLIVYNVAVQNSFLNVVCEFAQRQSVVHFLGEVRGKIASPNPSIPLIASSCVKDWFFQISGAVCDLHDNGVAHGDLRVTNLFIGSETEDYTETYPALRLGLPVSSRHLRQRLLGFKKQKEESPSTEVPTWIRYLPPELRKPDFALDAMSKVSDVWTFAYSMLSLISLVRCADDVIEEPLLETNDAVKEWVEAVLPCNAASGFREVFYGMLRCDDPGLRFRFKQVLRTAAHFDWEALLRPKEVLMEPRARSTTSRMRSPVRCASPKDDDDYDPPTESSPKAASSLPSLNQSHRRASPSPTRHTPRQAEPDRTPEPVVITSTSEDPLPLNRGPSPTQSQKQPRMTIDERRAKFKRNAQQQAQQAASANAEAAADARSDSPWRQRVSEQMQELEELQRRPASSTTNRHRPLDPMTPPTTPQHPARARSLPKSPSASHKKSSRPASAFDETLLNTMASQDVLRTLPKHERMRVVAESETLNTLRKEQFLKSKAEKELIRHVEKKHNEEKLKSHRNQVSSIKASHRGALSEAILHQKQRRAHSASANGRKGEIEIFVKQQPWQGAEEESKPRVARRANSPSPSPRPFKNPDISPASPPTPQHYVVQQQESKYTVPSSSLDDSINSASRHPTEPSMDRQHQTPIASKREESVPQSPKLAKATVVHEDESSLQSTSPKVIGLTEEHDEQEDAAAPSSPPARPTASEPKPQSASPARRSASSSGSQDPVKIHSTLDTSRQLLRRSLVAQAGDAAADDLETTIMMFASLTPTQRASATAIRMFEREIQAIVNEHVEANTSTPPSSHGIVALCFQLGALEALVVEDRSASRRKR